MIYVTGDTHGDIERFKLADFRKIKKNDTLIICGDFGFIWNGSKTEVSIMKKLSSKDYTIAFIDGCHENFDLLESYPESMWNGGKVHKIAGNIVHLMRGEIYNIENKKIFTFGGGHSHDYEFRKDGKNWWEHEQPTHEEITYALKNLELNSNKVDYIITHEPPASLKDCLRVDVFERLEVHAFFEELIKTCSYEQWFFGKCHIDKYIPLKFHAVFNKLYQIK